MPRQTGRGCFAAAPMARARPKCIRPLGLSAYLAGNPAVRFDGPAYTDGVLPERNDEATALGADGIALGHATRTQGCPLPMILLHTQLRLLNDTVSDRPDGCVFLKPAGAANAAMQAGPVASEPIRFDFSIA